MDPNNQPLPPNKAEANPIPKDFADKLENLRKQKEDSPIMFPGTIIDLENLAEGRDDDGIGKQYYPGWSADDFKKLLAAIEHK